MMLSVAFEVKFRVRAKTRSDEVVCITGDCPALGDWDPHHAVAMRRQTRKNNPSENESMTDFGECSEDGVENICDVIWEIPASGGTKRTDSELQIRDIWLKSLRLEGFNNIQYRYFIGRIYESENEGDSGRHVRINWWEGHIRPRKFSPQDAMSKYQSGEEPEPDVFGNHDGIRLINRGWLTDNVEIQLQLHSNPISMWKQRYREQTYSIRCTPLDYRYKDTVDDQYDQELHGDSMPTCAQSDILVSVLEKGRSKPHPQKTYGSVYKPNNFMTFHATTFEPENLGFQLDLYVHDNHEDAANPKTTPRHVGFSFILPLELKKSTGTKKIPITGFKHKPIGHLNFDFLLVKPLMGASFTMRQTFQNYWKPTRKPVDVGHRGMGSSYKCKKLVPVRENTVQSLQSAAQHGADFVEFDVQLTKDQICVIYHDFKVLITYRKKKREDLELFEIPVKDLTLGELQSMKLSHPSYQPEHKYEDIQEDDVDHEDLQPFPTLKRIFEAVDRHTGFNIEVKFPQVKVDGSGSINNFFDSNKYVDTILKCVFENHNGRRIVFSSFSANVCTLLRQKQNIYPVLYLTQADTPRYVMYKDIRTQSVQMATEICLSAGLLGVDVVADVLLTDMSLIKYAKDAGLVMFVWGEGCNDTDVIHRFRENKVDGIIYDRIDFYKTDTKESIFKIEEKEKIEIVRRIGSLRVDEPSDSGNDSQ